jgi:hypothetical protein
MKLPIDGNYSPLPRGEARDGALTSRRGPGEGLLPTLILSSAYPPVRLELRSASAQSEIPLPRLRDRNDIHFTA